MVNLNAESGKKMNTRKNSDVLKESLSFTGRRVLDIGCGDGALARALAREGAIVTGLEPSAKQLEKARAKPPLSGETFIEGSALDLPFEAQVFDIVVFFNSLHHIPMEGQGKALEEAARVLCADGHVYICEPVAEGPHFELIQPIDDETIVRARAQEEIKKAAQGPFESLREEAYTHVVRRESFEDFREKIIAPDPQRAAIFALREAEIRASFEALSEPADGGFLFAQPMRVNLLRKKN
jgi:ubiquinone/menaquinone biosynthesis C-methylase UbiE